MHANTSPIYRVKISLYHFCSLFPLQIFYISFLTHIHLLFHDIITLLIYFLQLV